MPSTRRTRTKVTYVESSDSEVEISLGSEAEIEPTVKPGKRKRKPAGARAKRAQGGSVSAAATVIDLPEPEKNYLYESLSNPESSVIELVQDWLDEYDTSPDQALQTLLNLVLCSCGCMHRLEQHDITNLELALETVGELEAVFVSQTYHEYPFASKRQELKFYKRNCLDFITNVVELANEKGMLQAEEDTYGLMERVLMWLSALSALNVRPLRYVATLFLLAIQTKLCVVVVKATALLEKNQRQLVNEAAKQTAAELKLEGELSKKERVRLEKEARTSAGRVASIEGTMADHTTQKVTLEDYLKEISNTTFVHRYRDIDPQIRLECMRSLGLWMDLYPEIFFEAAYLRYFGWLLHDSAASVRLEVVRALARLYRKGVIIPGFRQFTERFKPQFLEMVHKDGDFAVKLGLVHLLTEVARVGFLEESESEAVAALVFTTESTAGNTARLRAEVSKFIELMECDHTQNHQEKYQVELVAAEAAISFSTAEMIKLNALVRLLLQIKPVGVGLMEMAEVALVVLSLPRYRTVWEPMMQYLLLDVSALEGLGSLDRLLELSPDHQEVLFAMIIGETRLALVDDQRAPLVIGKTVQYLPQLFAAVQGVPTLVHAFVSFFTLFDLLQFRAHHQEPLYLTVTRALLRMYRESTLTAGPEMKAFLARVWCGDEYLRQEVQADLAAMVSALVEELMAHLAAVNTAELTSLKPLQEPLLKLTWVAALQDQPEFGSLCEALIAQVVTHLPDMGLAAETEAETTVGSLLEFLLVVCGARILALLKRDEAGVAEPDQLSLVVSITKELKELFTPNFNLKISGLAAGAFIDVVTALRIVQVRFRIPSFERFFALEFDDLVLLDSVQQSLLAVFLFKEAAWADALDVVLERGELEDVDYSSVVDPTTAERLLAVYTLKLLSLQPLLMLSDAVVARLRLNKTVLGKLFSSVLEMEVLETPSVEISLPEAPEARISQEDPIEDDGDIRLDTIAEVSKAEAWDEGFSQLELEASPALGIEADLGIQINELIGSSDDLEF